MRLSDPSSGVPDSELSQVDLEGNALGDYREFWERAARVDAIRAIADQTDADTFETSGLPEREALAPLIKPSDRVLEIGCGIGRVMQHVATMCAEVHGVDISSEMVKSGAERLAHLPNVVFHVGNGYDLGGFDDDGFEVVYSTIALQHMPKTTAFNYLREANRVLRKNGLLWLYVPSLLTEHNFSAFNHFCQPHFVLHPYPMHFFTPAEITALLVMARFSVVTMSDQMVIEARKTRTPAVSPEVAQLIRAPGPILESVVPPEARADLATSAKGVALKGARWLRDRAERVEARLTTRQ